MIDYFQTKIFRHHDSDGGIYQGSRTEYCQEIRELYGQIRRWDIGAMPKKDNRTEKTNAARLLDKAGIEYQLVPYAVDENDLAATHIAEQLGEPIEQVFKTLVLSGDRTGYFVCVVPGNAEVDLKAAAKVSGNKKCDLIPMKDLLGVTGYIRGGCSPVGMKKQFPTFLEELAAGESRISISAGQRGVQVLLSPEDLRKYTGAQYCSLILEKGEETEA